MINSLAPSNCSGTLENPYSFTFFTLQQSREHRPTNEYPSGQRGAWQQYLILTAAGGTLIKA
ncbi:MAG: hypothetical protein QM802_20915 [Agriterribacter sp.]